MKILGTRILIKPDNSVKESGLIIIPKANDQEGIVMAIGSDVRESLPYKKGSRVFISMYSGFKIKALDQEMLLVSKDDICGVEIEGYFHPIGDNILLSPVKEIVTSNLLIQLPDWSGDKGSYQEGEVGRFKVHLVGHGIKKKDGSYRPFDVVVGDEVLAKPFSGRDVDTIQGTFKLVKQEHILAKYEQ